MFDKNAVHLSPVRLGDRAACQDAAHIPCVFSLRRAFRLVEHLVRRGGICKQVALIVVNVDMRAAALVVQNKFTQRIEADLALQIPCGKTPPSALSASFR